MQAIKVVEEDSVGLIDAYRTTLWFIPGRWGRGGVQRAFSYGQRKSDGGDCGGLGGCGTISSSSSGLERGKAGLAVFRRGTLVRHCGSAV